MSVVEACVEACKSAPIGQGRFCDVYDIKGFPDLVFRYPRSDKFEPSPNKDALSLVDYGLESINVGQPIAEVGLGKILIKKPGRTFGQLRMEKTDYSGGRRKETSYKAYVEIVEKIARMPQGSYTDIMSDIKQLLLHGHAIDGGGDNLMIHNQKLGLVDVNFFDPIQADTHSRPERLLQLLVGNTPDLGVPFISHDKDFVALAEDPELPEKLQTAYKMIIKKWLHAAQKVALPINVSRETQLKALLSDLLKDKDAVQKIIGELHEIPQLDEITAASDSPKTIETLTVDVDSETFNEKTRHMRKRFQQSASIN